MFIYTVWDDLQQIPKTDHHFSHDCLDDLITTVSNGKSQLYQTHI